MVIRIPVNLDVTDNDIAESIEDEVDRGARNARSGRAGNLIGRALGIGIGDGIQEGIGDGVSRGIKRSVGEAQPGIQTFGQLGFSLAQVGAGATTAVSAITPLGGALGGVVAGAVAVAGALAQAAGAAVSLGGVLASVGLAAGVTSIATRGLSGAFDAQAKAQEELARTGEISEATQDQLRVALEGLAPAAREVVAQVQNLTPAWTAMQQAVQGRFFEGLGESMRVVSDTILPVLSNRFTETAGIINGALQSFAGFASSEGFVRRLDGILAVLNSTLTALLPGLGQIADALLTIFGNALGEAPGLAQAFTDIATQFNRFITAAAQAGDLNVFFRESVSVFNTLVGIVGNVGSILTSVFGAGTAVGATLLRTLGSLTQTLADFLKTASAQAGLAQFFDLVSQTGDTIAGLGAVIAPIFQGVFAVIGELIPHINALRDALLPVAITIGENLGVALTGLAPLLGFIAGLIVGLVQVLAPLVEVLVGALGPALAEIGALFMADVAPAIQSLIPLLAPVVAWFSAVFAAQIQNVVRLIVTVIGAVFKILGGLIDLIAGVFTGDWSRAWNGIKNIFSGVVDAVIGIVRFLWNTVINQFVGNSAQLRNVVTQVNAFLKASFLDAVNNVIAFFRGLPGQIGAAIGNLGGLLFGAGQNVIQGLIDGIRSMIGRVGSAMASIAAKIRSYLPFSPAKEGPLSGAGNPENSGQKIVEMLSSGISSGVELPAQAMASILTPLTPAGTQSALPDAGGTVSTAAGTVINQNFFGPTTSGGRLQEMNWTTRYATQARTETVGGVAT